MSGFKNELADFLEHYPGIQYIDTLLPVTGRAEKFCIMLLLVL